MLLIPQARITCVQTMFFITWVLEIKLKSKCSQSSSVNELFPQPIFLFKFLHLFQIPYSTAIFILVIYNRESLLYMYL